MTDLVIGSGPSGIAVATALLARGRKVLMLDAGKQLEPDRAADRDRLAQLAPQDWTDADRAAWQEPQYATPSGQVRRYGSDFAMEPAAVPAWWRSTRFLDERSTSTTDTEHTPRRYYRLNAEGERTLAALTDAWRDQARVMDGLLDGRQR